MNQPHTGGARTGGGAGGGRRCAEHGGPAPEGAGRDAALAGRHAAVSFVVWTNVSFWLVRVEIDCVERRRPSDSSMVCLNPPVQSTNRRSFKSSWRGSSASTKRGSRRSRRRPRPPGCPRRSGRGFGGSLCFAFLFFSSLGDVKRFKPNHPQSQNPVHIYRAEAEGEVRGEMERAVAQAREQAGKEARHRCVGFCGCGVALEFFIHRRTILGIIKIVNLSIGSIIANQTIDSLKPIQSTAHTGPSRTCGSGCSRRRPSTRRRSWSSTAAGSRRWVAVATVRSDVVVCVR